jgi:uncharacterized protein YndB with AHSA1/START domain
MTAMSTAPLPPIARSVVVSWDPATAFDRFTLTFATWWPYRTHSIGGQRVRSLVFEPHLGGRIYEEHKDGRRFQWGRVLAWEPPHRLTFTWHPSRDPSDAQEVELTFVPEGTGTKVTLTSVGWERLGKAAHRARRGYYVGWGYVLNTWAGRRTAGMAVLELLGGVINVVSKLRGGTDGEIARARGQMPPA